MIPQTAVIIPAAGFGTRMAQDQPKQYLELGGVVILVRTIRAFIRNQRIDQIVVVVPAGRVEQTSLLFKRSGVKTKGLQIVAGGARRQDSVRKGLQCLAPTITMVLVHDGARPLVSQEVINRCYDGAVAHGAAIAAIEVKDTLKRGTPEGSITGTVDRTGLYQAQTPQAARRELLEEAFRIVGEADVTDESSLLEKAGIPVTLVEGAVTNLKITRPEDLVVAEQIMQKHQGMAFRVGHGYDAHRFSENRALVLGGVTIAHSHGLAGHSDADVVTHALCDALLGALGEGDIGKHFPDSDNAFKDIYSINLLQRVVEVLEKKGYTLSNGDITVVCQAPRLAPHIGKMQELLSATCRIEMEQLNIKATTTEKMGFTGRKEGISCHAVVLLQASPRK